MDDSISGDAYCPRVSPLDQRHRVVPPSPFECPGTVTVYDAEGRVLRVLNPYTETMAKVKLRHGGTEGAVARKRAPMPHPGKQAKSRWQ